MSFPVPRARSMPGSAQGAAPAGVARARARTAYNAMFLKLQTSRATCIDALKRVQYHVYLTPPINVRGSGGMPENSAPLKSNPGFSC